VRAMDDAAEAGFSAPSTRRLRAMARQLCDRLGWYPNSDVLDDCCLEAVLLVWRLRGKIQEVPEGTRAMYVGVCIRNAMWRVLRRERQQARDCVSLDRPSDADTRLIEFLASPPTDAEGTLAETLLGCIEDPHLLAALQALPSADRSLLQLCYSEEMTDPAIAARLGRSPDAIRMRRRRALHKLRQALQQADAK